MVEESPDAAVAWIRNQLRPHGPGSGEGAGVSVGSLLPPSFDCYLRVLHRFTDHDGNFTTWSERAKSAEVEYHSQLSERALGRVINSLWSDAPWDASEGVMDELSRSALFRSLDAREMGRPVSMYFGISLQVYGEQERVVKQRLTEIIDLAKVRGLFEGELIDSPELIWPDDRSWVVCVDYDLTSTYIACDISLARILRSLPELEIMDTALGERVDYRSDTVNCGAGGLSLGPPLR